MTNLRSALAATALTVVASVAVSGCSSSQPTTAPASPTAAASSRTPTTSPTPSTGKGKGVPVASLSACSPEIVINPPATAAAVFGAKYVANDALATWVTATTAQGFASTAVVTGQQTPVQVVKALPLVGGALTAAIEKPTDITVPPVTEAGQAGVKAESCGGTGSAQVVTQRRTAEIDVRYTATVRVTFCDTGKPYRPAKSTKPDCRQFHVVDGSRAFRLMLRPTTVTQEPTGKVVPGWQITGINGSNIAWGKPVAVEE